MRARLLALADWGRFHGATFPAGTQVAQYLNVPWYWQRWFRRQGSRYRHHPRHCTFRRSTMDPVGWQKRFREAVSTPQSLEDRSRFFVQVTRTDQLLASAARDMGVNADLASLHRPARGRTRRNLRRGRSSRQEENQSPFQSPRIIAQKGMFTIHGARSRVRAVSLWKSSGDDRGTVTQRDRHHGAAGDTRHHGSGSIP